MCRPRRAEISSQTAVPRTLLPYASSPGEKTPIPNLPGTTAMMPPLTPLLAGMPIWYAHCPAKSYMPHVCMTLRTSLTYRGDSAQYAFERLLCGLHALYEGGRRERPCVDHRIVRAVVALVEDDGVKSIAARLHSYSLQDTVAAAGLQGQAVDEYLGDGLKGKRSVMIASVKDLTRSEERRVG